MTSQEIRQSFLDFFRSKGHTIVPSSSLMPDAPNLLFTNAGMNQFVPIFLGQQACPFDPARAADTQKCIRAGGKHNDLEDVGWDTYHHTFFEMLGNWSFGDYFKKEAIDWAWELLTEVWKFPKNRLYASVYEPDVEKGDPASFDEEAYGFWEAKFKEAGLDPKVHIVFGGKKDNFWMMGDTGPCGPCSELHVDLTPDGDTQGKLVNADSPLCIEIWNLVFIQFNANPDGTFADLPAKHVDTGMGFERVASVIQNTHGFTDFTGLISNYETDVFAPLFEKIAAVSGKRYTSTMPEAGVASVRGQEEIDVAFRVIADHVRTLSLAIADGIQPGNTDRNYVLRRILRRAVRYGRALDLNEPFLFKLVATLAENLGETFPELVQRQEAVETIIRSEEEAFNRTLDRGMNLFSEEAERVGEAGILDGAFAFKLYDTYGFPLDLTELMARERGLSVDTPGFEEHMEAQRARARAAQKKSIIEVTHLENAPPTDFVGYDRLSVDAEVLDVLEVKGRSAFLVDASPFYTEMGGQIGDVGSFQVGADLWRVVDTQQVENSVLHILESEDAPSIGAQGTLAIDSLRREAIARHHTATHLLHWALHEVVSHEATQKGSFVGTEKLTFDFNAAALTTSQVEDIERLVNQRVMENGLVSVAEATYADISKRGDITQAFGEKYGEVVRVVQIGGGDQTLDGYSMELCGGTHVAATGAIGYFRIRSEAAVSAGVRRIEAVAGASAIADATRDASRLKEIAGLTGAPLGELERKIEGLLDRQKELERELKTLRARQAAALGKDLIGKAKDVGGIAFIGKTIEGLDAAGIQSLAEAIQGAFDGVAVLMAPNESGVAIVVLVAKPLTKQLRAGDVLKAIAPLVDGKGGGRPEMARGAGKSIAGIADALREAERLVSEA